MSRVRTCLWFDTDAETAVERYVSLVPDSRVEHVQRAPGDWPAGKAGQVVALDFILGGQGFQALNGGGRQDYGFAASISVECAGQDEVERLWDALLEDGGEAIACGWLRDRWGVPWQIVPGVLPRLLGSPDREVAARVFAAMRTMIKLDGPALERAAQGDV